MTISIDGINGLLYSDQFLTDIVYTGIASRILGVPSEIFGGGNFGEFLFVCFLYLAMLCMRHC